MVTRIGNCLRDDFQGQACLDGPTTRNCVAMLFEEDIGKNDPSLRIQSISSVMVI